MVRLKCKSPAIFSVAVALIAASYTPAAAQDLDRRKALTTPPALYTDLLGCKDIADPTARLACFDEKVAALETAQSSNQVVIADREQVREARRGLFGLSLPRIKLFGGDGDEGDQIEQVEGVVQSARTLRSGKWQIRLEDGAVWLQTDTPRSSMRDPKPGDSIIIKRAALGSYMAKINNGRGFKVKRIIN